MSELQQQWMELRIIFDFFFAEFLKISLKFAIHLVRKPTIVFLILSLCLSLSHSFSMSLSLSHSFFMSLFLSLTDM